MAIQFLSTVDLNQNQLNNAAIQNVAADPITGVLGQIIFNTTVGKLKVCVTASSTGPTVNASYEEIGGGVETFTNSSGTYIAYGTDNTNAIGDVTTGSIDLTAIDGTSNSDDRFLTKNNKWATIPFGDITEVQGGTYVSVANQTGPVPIVNHDTTTRVDTTSSSSPGSSGNFTTVDSVTTNSTGHVTALNVKTITLPTSDNYVQWVASDNTVSNNISSNETIKWVGAGTTSVALSGDTFTITSNDQFDGTLTNVLQGTYISIDNSTAAQPAVNHDLTSRTDSFTNTTNNLFQVVKSVSTNSTGHVTGIEVNMVTVPDNNTTYSLSTASAGTAISLTGNPSDNDVTISGTAGRTSVTRISDLELRVNLTDNVVVVGDLTTGGELTVQGTGTSSFLGAVDMSSNKILNVQTGTAASDAVNLGQVELLVAGIGVFKGAYDATANSPALEGSSNIALDTGDYFVVNVAGTFFTESLQVGDNIFAAVDIAASSSPSLSNYTVIQAGANIAGAGATDVATQKGIAGFDSADFLVSSSGWVQLNSASNPYGASVNLTGGVTVGSETTYTVDITTLFGATASAANCKVEVLRRNNLETVYPYVDRNGTGSIAFKFSSATSETSFKALISII